MKLATLIAFSLLIFGTQRATTRLPNVQLVIAVPPSPPPPVV